MTAARTSPASCRASPTLSSASCASRGSCRRTFDRHCIQYIMPPWVSASQINGEDHESADVTRKTTKVGLGWLLCRSHGPDGVWRTCERCPTEGEAAALRVLCGLQPKRVRRGHLPGSQARGG